MHCVPFESSAIDAYPRVRDWQATATELVRRMLDRWQLVPGPAYVGGISGSVVPVTRPDGSAAVLKVGLPHVEAIWEAVGLQAFPEGLAPAILDQDAWTWSLLMERVLPGTPLSTLELSAEEALRVGGELHLRLASGVVPAGIPTLADGMRDYVSQARARLPQQSAALAQLGVRDLVAEAIDDLEELAGSPAGTALLHGDYNPGNILRSSGREPWMVVDPKPLVGDPAYDLWPLVSQVGDPYRAHDPAARLSAQLEVACAAAEVDPVRAGRWSRARTGLNVTWYLQDDSPAQAAIEAAGLRAWNVVVEG